MVESAAYRYLLVNPVPHRIKWFVVPVPDDRNVVRDILVAWPYIIFGALVVVYTYFYFWKPTLEIGDYLQFLLNAIAGLAVVLYVIYTRELVKSGQQTAQANLELIATMRSLLLEEWVAQDRPATEIRLLPPGALELSRTLHISDLGMPADRYDHQCGRDKRRVLIFRPYNGGPLSSHLRM